jgi:hypothetical protein
MGIVLESYGVVKDETNRLCNFNHFATPCIRPYTLSGCEKVILCLTPENTEGYEATKGCRLICHTLPLSR